MLFYIWTLCRFWMTRWCVSASIVCGAILGSLYFQHYFSPRALSLGILYTVLGMFCGFVAVQIGGTKRRDWQFSLLFAISSAYLFLDKERYDTQISCMVGMWFGYALSIAILSLCADLIWAFKVNHNILIESYDLSSMYCKYKLCGYLTVKYGDRYVCPRCGRWWNEDLKRTFIGILTRGKDRPTKMSSLPQFQLRSSYTDKPDRIWFRIIGALLFAIAIFFVTIIFCILLD